MPECQGTKQGRIYHLSYVIRHLSSGMIQCIFWDNDGVLVDTEGLFFQSCREMLAENGVDLTREMFIDISLGQGHSTFDLLRDRGMPEDEVQAQRRRRDALYSDLLRGRNTLREGVAETLEALRGRYRMGVVTNSYREHFDIIHESTGILHYFDFMLTVEDYARSKPHPDAYLKALETAGCAPEECIVIEDTPRGLHAAQAAGIRCVVVPHDLTRGSDFTGAEKVLENVADILKVLE